MIVYTFFFHQPKYLTMYAQTIIISFQVMYWCIHCQQLLSQIIMDDAGFISEAEAIVPLVMHRGVNQLVLIGDLEMPRSQIKNPLASQLGLSRPLLQRFSERAQRLTMQYRCVSFVVVVYVRVAFRAVVSFFFFLNFPRECYVRCPVKLVLIC